MSLDNSDENPEVILNTIILPKADVKCGNQKLFQSIQNDDYELFQEETSNIDNIPVVRLEFSGSDVPWMLKDSPTIPFVVAYFSAKQCFDYIMTMYSLEDLTSCFDTYGRNIFYFAIAGGNLDILRLLTKTQFKDNPKDSRNNTIIHYAAMFGRADVLNWLYIHGWNDFSPRNEAGTTPFMWACESGNVEIAQFFLQNGARPNELNFYRVCVD